MSDVPHETGRYSRRVIFAFAAALGLSRFLPGSEPVHAQAEPAATPSDFCEYPLIGVYQGEGRAEIYHAVPRQVLFDQPYFVPEPMRQGPWVVMWLHTDNDFVPGERVAIDKNSRLVRV